MGDVNPDSGPCVWCGEHVTDERAVSGAEETDWAIDGGDFGCGESPETNEDGVGSHARPSDPVLRKVYTFHEILRWIAIRDPREPAFGDRDQYVGWVRYVVREALEGKEHPYLWCQKCGIVMPYAYKGGPICAGCYSRPSPVNQQAQEEVR
jgi:hypothetical protein